MLVGWGHQEQTACTAVGAGAESPYLELQARSGEIQVQHRHAPPPAMLHLLSLLKQQNYLEPSFQVQATTR